MSNLNSSSYNLPVLGTIIVHNHKNYSVIGHDFGIVSSSNNKKLPLNDLDKKIINYIQEEETNSIHNDFHDVFEDEKLHDCDERCQDLGDEFKNYIDKLIDDINNPESDFRDKWTRDYLLGFYRPIHFYNEWGIFIKATGQIRFANSIFNNAKQDQNRYGSPDINSCYLISKTFTFFHEYYHHKIESLAIRFELITRQPHYTSGFHCLYCNTFGTDRCLEEAFANTYAFFETYKRLFQYCSIMGVNKNQLRNILKELIIRNSPPGYNLAAKLIASDDSQIAKNYEYYFYEVLLRYSYKLNNGANLPEINDKNYWKNFKHATHPIINTDNRVTYVIDVDDVTIINQRDFLNA